MSLPDGLIAYGSDANCTLELCPVEASVLGYQPETGASIAFIVLFGITLVLHAIEGIIWRQTLNSFAIPIVCGCIDEIIGYIGRVIMHSNPFNFSGFLMQIICITTAPVFFCAAIYVTLARTIVHLDQSLARFNPKFLYWFFIPCDIISLVFQALGGALSSTSTGSDDTGVNLSLFGLAFQVFTLVVFAALSIDYMIRYYARRRRQPRAQSPHVVRAWRNFHIYLFFLAFAFLLILIRCIYRIDELSEGYDGELFKDEMTFYGLESAMIVTAIFFLNVGQPGFGMSKEMHADNNVRNDNGNNYNTNNNFPISAAGSGADTEQGSMMEMKPPEAV